MLRLHIVALLAITASALENSCKDGVEISTQVINNPEYLIGNWSYIYHWGHNQKQSAGSEDSSESVLKCPGIEILPITPEYVKEKEGKCGKDIGSHWNNAKLRMSANFLSIRDEIILVGDNSNWFMADCSQDDAYSKMIPIEAKKASKDVMVLINPLKNVFELLSRKPVTGKELSCLAQNVDVGKGVNGVNMCF